MYPIAAAQTGDFPQEKAKMRRKITKKKKKKKTTFPNY
jgi:hypothetical protein